MEVAMKTHIGHIRQVNEDCAEVLSRDGVVFAIVADGMGGHKAGDVASQMAIKKLKEAFESAPLDKNASDWEDWLLNIIQEANQYIFQYAIDDEVYSGMGTTIVAAVFSDDYYVVAHVGDSRMYRFKSEQQFLERITEDHSLVNELLRSGQITKQEAEDHPQRNVITRALGTEEIVDIDIQTFTYLSNEQILLCSDGLTNMLSDKQIVQALSKDSLVNEKASILIQEALDAGGDDNITLILVAIDGDKAGEK